MQKGKRMVLALVVIACLCVGWSTTRVSVYAQDNLNLLQNARMKNIYSYGTNLSITDDGIAIVTAQIVADSTVESVFLRVRLQQFVRGNWVTVNSWEGTYANYYASISATCQVSAGTYRTEMTCSAGSETKTTTSGTQAY